MQRNDRLLAWGALAIFATIALELAWLILVGSAHGSAHCSIGDTPQCDLPWWDSAAFWTAAFTFCLTVSTVLLWLSTRDSVDVAKRAMTELEQAYVFFDDARRDTPNTYVITFANHGKTPGIAISRRLACEYSEQLPKLSDAPEHHFPRGAIIGTDEPWPRGRVDVTEGMLGQARYGQGRIYLFGELRYSDIFGKKHRTWFCRRLNHHQFILDDITDPDLNGYD
jgi:hypothetical protein